MKTLFTGLLISTLFLLTGCSAQKATTSNTINELITLSEVSRIENMLASDEMQGRKTFTPGIEKAADFIASEFKSIGLQAPANGNDYLQSFSMVRATPDADPVSYEISATHEITEQPLANVVGILQGKSRANEYVIFSAHYDHLGIGKAINGDSIYNGANDNAAGVTAMIMLARYYKSINSNERTLIFAAFTAEEMGGFGSQYFSRQYKPELVMAMFNIEMIGTESKWGKNSAFITGYEKTNMGEIMNKDLAGSGFTFHPDPYPAQQLFYRSDNATLARLGVPAHTISTAKMDAEPHYHKPSDHVETLDLDNMTAIIRAIAISAGSIVTGTATPSRVKVEDLR